MEKIQSHVDAYVALAGASTDINSPDKLESMKKLSDLLKQSERALLADETCHVRLGELFTFFIGQLHKITSKDVIRKLFIRCLVSLSKSIKSTSALRKSIAELFFSFLKDETVIIGQRLFIMNIYLENLDDFGIQLINENRVRCFELFIEWSSSLKDDLKTAKAPIVISKLAQNLQLLLKTLILFLQRSLTASQSEITEEVRTQLDFVQAIVLDLLSMQETFELELGYPSSMVYILLSSLKSKDSLRKIIEKSLTLGSKQSTNVISIRELCLYQAVLTMLKPAQLINDQLLDLIERLLLRILSGCSDSVDVGHSIAMTRAVNYWCIKYSEIVQSHGSDLNDLMLGSGSDWFNQLLAFIWSHFDHNIDVIRTTNVQNYKLLLKFASYVKKDRVMAFYEDEVKKCMQLSWQVNSKFNALILLLDNGISTSRFIELNENIAHELIEAITERSTACLVADLYSRLFRVHREELEVKSKDPEIIADYWTKQWWSPILATLSSNDKLRKSYIYEYVLPRLMKIFPDGIEHCQRISNSYSTIISCTKISRSLGILAQRPANEGASEKTYLFGSVDQQILEKSIVHSDDQTRLDALALICENPKTTEAITPVELELVKKFLYYNSDSISASYRQSLLASLKKMFGRFKESWTFHMRTAARVKKPASEGDSDALRLVESSKRLTVLYEAFIGWLFDFTFSSLHLDSTFAKRNQNLLIISLFVEIIGMKFAEPADADDSVVLFEYQRMFDRKRLVTLIEMLWDTYVNNKNIALDLLLKVDKKIFDLYGFSMTDYFVNAIDLLSSRKPVDSVTSVYLIMFIRKKATLEDLKPVANRPDLACFFEKKQNCQNLGLFLVKSIAIEFENQTKVCCDNLLLAALRKPVYGSLAAVHTLIMQSIDEIKKGEQTEEWVGIISHLMELSFEVSKIVSPIVTSSSPEGIFPAELLTMQPNIANSEYIKSVTPQMLLVCCWRTMKEVSLFFGDLVRYLPIEYESPQEKSDFFILSCKQIFSIGDYFMKHLFETRHRGAFELAYVGFTSLCETFWNCKASIYCEQPIKWLDNVLELIQTEESRNKLFSTRRGGGLPFFVQAIVSTELVRNSKKSLEKTMGVLLRLAETRHEKDEQNFSRVLSMYVLGALIKDARIGEDILQYVERALMAAIDGFDSVFWNVRNSSTLLFSSLINRIFGVNRSKEEISKKNSMPGRMFFIKFPRLYEFFLNIINESIETLDTNLNAKLYLIVLILCHLFTLSDETSDPEALLHNFVPGLLKCCRSPVMKTRVFIAKAIGSIVHFDRYPTLISEIVDKHLPAEMNNNDASLDSSQAQEESQDLNKIHGVLQVLNVLVSRQNIFKYAKAESVLKKLNILVDQVKSCPVNAASLLDLLIKIFGSVADYSQEANKCVAIIHELIQKAVEFLISRVSASGKATLLLPGTHDYLNSLAQGFCLILDRQRGASGQDSFLDVDSLKLNVTKLLSLNDEYSSNFMRGLTQYLNQFSGSATGSESDDNAALDSSFNKTKTTARQMEPILLTDLSSISKRVIQKTILGWNSDPNSTHHLKNACDLLTTLMKLDSAGICASSFDLSEKLSLWKALSKFAEAETEADLRISLLNSMTQLYEFVSTSIASKGHNELCDLLDSYLDRQDETLALVKFLAFRANHLFDPNSSRLESGVYFRLWSMVLQILTDVHDQEACAIACEIVSSLSRKNQSQEKEDAIYMSKLALETIVETLFVKHPSETIKFLIDEFTITSECDSTQSENDEELETVFDRGVDSIHCSHYYYAIELSKSIEILIHRLENHQECTQAEKEKAMEFFLKSYGQLTERLSSELNEALVALSRDKMSYNDIRYTSIACHLLYLTKLEHHLAEPARETFHNVSTRLDSNRPNLNCLIQSFLN